MRIRIRRCDNEVQEAQVADSQVVIVAACAVLTADYMDRKPVFRILCGSI
jgi:hypothetical protein